MCEYQISVLNLIWWMWSVIADILSVILQKGIQTHKKIISNVTVLVHMDVFVNVCGTLFNDIYIYGPFIGSNHSLYSIELQFNCIFPFVHSAHQSSFLWMWLCISKRTLACDACSFQNSECNLAYSFYTYRIQ